MTGRPAGRLGMPSSVLALVPHYRCEEWLGDCLESLLSQTRPPQGIAVIDDCSEVPPLEIVRRFPGVTLLKADRNVGPYRLIQGVIDRTDHDAYLFNDADDWSARERLEVLLEAAARTGAELIGSQEVRVLCNVGEAIPYAYPEDVNEALSEQPCSFPLLHPTSLIARTLLTRLGGFATGMRFSGDAELLRRAGHVARIVNVPEHLYFRRKRDGALTTAPETGLTSPARRQVQQVLWDRARRNAELVREGERPDLAPLTVAGSIALTHLWGPPLWEQADSTRCASRRAPRISTRSLRPGSSKNDDPVTAKGRPVFVLGPSRSGTALLTWCLAQHPSFAAAPIAAWAGKLALHVQDLLESGLELPSSGRFEARRNELEVWAKFAGALDRLGSDASGLRWVDGTPENAFHAYGLLRLFPGARFIHVVRDVATVVDSLAHLAASDGSYYTEETAAECWLRTTRAAVTAERALGSRTVLRVRHSDLVRDSEATIRRCLAHLDEEFAAACLRPLRQMSQGGLPSVPVSGGSGIRLEAERLSDELLREAEPKYPGSREELDDLARQYRARSGRGNVEFAEEAAVRRVREIARATIPIEATVLVVSRGDEELLDLGGARGWHFPQTDDGTYAGYHPGDSAEAITQLERLRERGAEFLLLPCTGFWWLDHYTELRAHLERVGRVAAYQENACIIFALTPVDGARSPGPRLTIGGVNGSRRDGRRPEGWDGNAADRIVCALDVRLRSFREVLDDARHLGPPAVASPPPSAVALSHRRPSDSEPGGPPGSGGDRRDTSTSSAIRALIREGYRLRREGDLSAALQRFERAVAVSPDHERARRGRDTVAGEIAVLRDGWWDDDDQVEEIEPAPGRILHLVGRSLPGAQTGYAIRTHYVASAQRSAGLDPHVVTQLQTATEGEEVVALEFIDGIAYHRLVAPSSIPVGLPDRLSANVDALTSLVRRLRPAVLHAATDYRNALVALALGKRFNLPVVYEVRGFWEETRLVRQGDGAEERDSYRWHRRREIACAEAADLVVTLSNGMRSHLVEEGVGAERIQVIPNAVDPEVVTPGPKRGELARHLGIGADEVVVGYVSSFEPYEGIHILLEAIAQLRGRGHRVKGLLVGDGEIRGELEALAAALGISEQVIFVGRVPHGEIPRYYRLIDVFVVPRTADRVCQLVTPLKPYEAMAAGCAVVVARVSALQEMVQQGVTGLVFPPGDSTALTGVVEPLIEDAGYRQALGLAAWAWVCRHRTWRQNGERYVELYRSLEGDSSASPGTEGEAGASGPSALSFS
ncbi:MAG: glycosyltransferase [Gemmatimonas sp.]|nr:glycosyltransferase [Gemmatimonas sp.]